MVLCLSVSMPKQAFAQADEGIKLYNAGDYVKAESKLRMQLMAQPGNTEARYYLGLSLLYQGKFAEALKELKTVKSEHEKSGQRSATAVPSAYQIDLALAKSHLGLGQFEEAWPELESARMEDPESSDVYLYSGIYYYKQKKYPQAIEALEKSISLDPQNAYAYYYVGMAYHETENVQKMLDSLKMFLQLAPDSPEAPEVKKLHDAFC
jgi:superkiller protein 3